MPRITNHGHAPHEPPHARKGPTGARPRVTTTEASLETLCMRACSVHAARWRHVLAGPRRQATDTGPRHRTPPGSEARVRRRNAEKPSARGLGLRAWTGPTAGLAATELRIRSLTAPRRSIVVEEPDSGFGVKRASRRSVARQPARPLHRHLVEVDRDVLGARHHAPGRIHITLEDGAGSRGVP